MDVPKAIVVLYGISSLSSILIDFYDLRSYDTWNYEISLGATIIYCIMFMLCFFPLIDNQIKGRVLIINPLTNTRVIKILSIICFAYFVLTFIMSFNSIINILNGDLNEMRRLISMGEGETLWLASLPSLVRLPFVIIGMAMENSWIMIFLAMFCMTIQKMEKKYILFFAVASLYSPILGILGADRSRMTYWIVSLFVIYVFFKPFFSNSQKKIVKILGLIVIVAIVVYFVAMTISRFGNTTYGAQNGIISYLGQSFINFTFFFDNLDSSEINLSVIFPLFNKYFGNYMTTVNLQKYMSLKTGYALGVFYPFFGHIMVMAGKMVMFFYCVLFSLISMFLFQRKKELDAFTIFLFLTFASVLFLGLFNNYYANPGCTFGILFWTGILYHLSKEKS